MTVEQALREAAAALLTTTDAGANVFPMRWEPADESILPAICLYTIDSPAENVPGDIGERRKTGLDVVLYASGPRTPANPADSADVQLDALREQVEALLNKMYDFWGVANVIRKEYKGFKIKANTEQNPKAERLTLAAVMRYDFDYIYENQGV